MRIELVVAKSGFRRWHEILRARLQVAFPQAQVVFRVVDEGEAWPGDIASLLMLERMLLRRSRPTFHDRITPQHGVSHASRPDIAIDLTGAEALAATSGERRLRPLYNGRPGETAAAAALLAGAAPTIGVEDVTTGALLAGLPSLEAADGLTGGLEAVASRMITLIVQAAASPHASSACAAPVAEIARQRSAAAFFLRNMARCAARAIYHLLCHSPHWRVGWRLIDGPGVLETGHLGGAPWTPLLDRELNFAADPFPIRWQGRSMLFYEQLDYRTNRGEIYAREFDRSGPIGEPIHALAEPWHLSYPHLIEHDGTLYMLPEASTSKALSLYRCVEFPHRWECVAHLLDDVEIADATTFRHAGRFWMTSVIRDGAGGYSDTLVIHHAHDLLGPWEQHAQRPVLIDSRCARPAGAVVEREGALWRPAQDCSTGYGKGLALARIDALDQTSFRQTITRVISPDHNWPGSRLHTLNRSGPLEVIDGVVITPKNMTLRRLVEPRARK